MAKLDAGKRRALRDSDYAYVDQRGRRRLPINDESHVRNALSRFNQVVFEDEAARDRARTRLLKAAKKYGIVPIGFVTGQLRTIGSRDLPSGAITFLMTDIEESTALLLELGEQYASVLADARRLARTVVRRGGGWEVDARADEYFAVFRTGDAAVQAALTIQRRLAEHAWPAGAAVRVRMGIHSGRTTLVEGGYVGVAVHAVARICGAARGGQVLISRAGLGSMGEGPAAISVREVGPVPLKGLGTQVLFEVSAAGS